MKKLLVVILYSVIFLMLMVVDTLKKLGIEYTGIELVYISIVMGYAGISQWTAYLKSGEMPKGVTYNDNVNKLYATMAISFILAFVSLILSMIYENNSLPVGSLFTAFGTSSLAYVVGQSAKIKKENECKKGSK